MHRLTSLRLYEKCRSLLTPLQRSALLTADLEILYLKPESLSDLGTLPQTVEITHKYLQLNDGDITLTSDPYSGGTVVTSPTLVMGVGNCQKKSGAEKGKVPAEILIASRLTFRAKPGQPKTIDDEGLRIPPTPIYSQTMRFNTAVTEAIKSHPLAPADLIPRVEAEIEKLLKLRVLLKEELRSGLFERATVRQFLTDCEREFAHQLDEFSEGVGTSELDLSESETIRVKAEIHDGSVHFDFTGTTPGKSIFITDSCTIGTAVGTFISLFKAEVPVNTGVLSRFEIKAPRDTLVNSSFPRPLFLGHTDGVNFLANAILLALSHIDPKLSWAMTGPSYCAVELKFENESLYYASLPSGFGATNAGPGLDGAIAWRKFVFGHSVEEVERKFPVQFLHCGFRANSSGQGKFTGGLGASESLRLLEPAVLRWGYLKAPQKPIGLNGGKSGQDSEIIVQRASGQKTVLPFAGEMAMQPGDIITMLSAGGGGYGTLD